MQPVRFGLVGLGGYARWIMELLIGCTDAPNPPVQLIAAAEPNLAGFPERVELLKKRGVKLFSSYDELLKLPDVEAVWLPVPIDLHRPFVEMAVKAKKAVVVEKPVTGSVDDLAAMIAAREAGGGRVAVAFQDIYSDSTLQLKQALIDGVIGTPRSATVHACWPRGSAYYGRNNWAGKIQVRGTWVLDSPANNAIAHYLNLALFFLGQSQREMVRPDSVTAELYRVNDIENYDTCSLRIQCNGGVPLLVHFTHACGTEVRPHITIHGSQGTLKYEANVQAMIGDRTVSLRGEEVRQQMVRKLAQWIRGDSAVIPVSLEMAGVHLSIINGASEASPVNTIPNYEQKPVGEDDLIRLLPGIEALFARASEEQKMLGELGDVPWAAAGRTKDLRHFTHFAGPAR